MQFALRTLLAWPGLLAKKDHGYFSLLQNTQWSGTNLSSYHQAYNRLVFRSRAQDSWGRRVPGFSGREGLKSVSWHRPFLPGVLLPYGLRGNYIQLLACAPAVAFFHKAEGCWQREYHCKKIAIFVTLNQNWQDNSSKGKLVSFCVSSWGQMGWNYLRSHKIQATELIPTCCTSGLAKLMGKWYSVAVNVGS